MAKEEFRVYNSMTQPTKVFTPKEPGNVGIYVCGITAYDFSQIGHARAAVNFDVLYSDCFCQEYLADMVDLQCLSPTHQPRVSE